MKIMKRVISIIMILLILSNQIVNATFPTPSELLSSTNTSGEYDKIKSILESNSNAKLIVGANIKGKYCSWGAGWNNVENIISASSDRLIAKIGSDDIESIKETKDNLGKIKDLVLYLITYSGDIVINGNNSNNAIVDSSGGLKLNKVKEITVSLLKIFYKKAYTTEKISEIVNEGFNRFTPVAGTNSFIFVNYKGEAKKYDLDNLKDVAILIVDLIDYILNKYYGNNLQKLETIEQIVNVFLKAVMEAIDKSPSNKIYKTLIETAVISWVTAYFGISKCNEEKNMEISTADEQFKNAMNYGIKLNAEVARQYVLKTKYSKFPEKDKITLESRMKSFYKGCFDDINAYVENTKTSVNTSALEYNLNTDRVKTKKENQKSAYAKKYCGTEYYYKDINSDILAEKEINFYLTNNFGNSGVGYINAYLKVGIDGWESDILLQSLKNEDFTDYNIYNKSVNNCKVVHKNSKSKQISCVSKLKKVINVSKINDTFNTFLNRLTIRKLEEGKELNYLNELTKKLWADKLINLNKVTLYDTILGKAYQRIDQLKILIKNKKDKEDKIKKYLENKKITPATITPAKTVITNQQSQTLTEKLLEQQKNCKLYESTRIYNKGDCFSYNGNVVTVLGNGLGNSNTKADVRCDTNDIVIWNGSDIQIWAACNIGATNAVPFSEHNKVMSPGNHIPTNEEIKRIGYYFQWGNNGFVTDDSNTNKQIDTSNYKDSNYSSNNFFMPLNNLGWLVGGGDWSLKTNNNLWGDTTNTNIARKGPCSTGYHVPSMIAKDSGGIESTSDWGKAYQISKNSPSLGSCGSYPEIVSKNTKDTRRLQCALMIPSAGIRTLGESNYQQCGGSGFCASLWSSSPYKYSNNSANYVTFNSELGSNMTDKVNGMSVRCIKN